MADTFRLARSAFIQAPPQTVHALVNDFHRWGQWSPWALMDAGRLQETHEGPDAGVGAAYGWVGPKTGSGRMEILASSPEAIAIQLDFLKPMKARNRADFTFAPEGEGTQVAWVMTGPQTLIGKIMGLLFSMEKMVGGQFEQGLANMKRAAEAAAPNPAPVVATAKAVAPKASAKPAAAPRTAAKRAPAKVAAPKAKPAAKAKAKAPAIKAAAKPAAKPASAPAKTPAARVKSKAPVKKA